jgi:hypothetical protein
MNKMNCLKGVSLCMLAASIWSCAPRGMISATDTSNSATSADGSCSVSQENGGAMISCPDGSQAFVPNGTNGTNGVDGTNGTNGTDGKDGKDGLNGTNGSSCSVQDLGTKALITCTDGTTAIIEDGINGKDGTNGTDGEDGADGKDGSSLVQYPVINIINPCNNKNDELLEFANGDIIERYSTEQKTFMLLTPGVHMSKSDTKCKFTVTSSKK